MASVKYFFSKWGFHCFLLPVFFILHNYIQYYGLVSKAVAIKTFAEICGIILLFFLFIRFLTKNTGKSLQVTTLTSFVLLFYGVVKDFLSKTLGLLFFARYTVMLPLTAIIIIIIYVIIIRKKDFSKINLFQNILLLIFIFTDASMAVFIESRVFINRNMLAENDFPRNKNIIIPAKRPDVYYLIFDCYPGTGFLQEFMQFDNTPMDSALRKRGFSVIGHPKSNYNRTAFSMASALNFKYLDNIKNNSKITSKQYAEARLTIKKAAVPAFFSAIGYKLYNLSIFEILGIKPLYREDFLTLPEQNVLLYNTLPERLRTDILWNIFEGKYRINFIKKMLETKQSELVKESLKKRDFNKMIADSLQAIPDKTANEPRFIYAHFYLPHPPFFFRENGEANDIAFITTDKSLTNKQLFLSYLKYTNKVILKLVDTILKKSQTPPVIIVQSDHGFRDFEGGPRVPNLFFKNYTAYYFPDKNYSMLYDTMSNINTFPVILNKYFNTRIPIQRDTITFLPY